MSVAVSSPGSPPELTESQSSKTSSYASQLSNSEDFTGGTMNFEDINLDDENHRIEGGNKAGQEDYYANPYRAKRPVLATLQTHHAGYSNPTEKIVRSAVTPNTKRNFSSPTIQVTSSKYGQRTRSESPVLHKTRSASKLGQYAQTPESSLSAPGRRRSWQPTRKTIYEIEAEYHDSDDELPDDASLYNVPLSPFVHSRNTPLSARSSAKGSPERESFSLSPAPIPLSHAFTAPDGPPKPRHSSRTLPRQRLATRSSSLQVAHSKSASTSPRDEMRYGRTKSWNLVMADLDHEARVVAEKLEFHLEARAKLDASNTNAHRVSAPGAIPLPPIQRGTLDFMPMSKEKEAVLSRTRPSWLPPKDPREEKRHLEEYTRMMKASIEADKKREEKIKQEQNANEDAQGSLQRIWTYYVEPTTDINAIDKRVNDLCWRGIPPKLRGRVWQRKVGNSLGLTKEDYATITQKIQEIKSRPIEKLTKDEKLMQEWFADIERDAETAFPDLSIFQRNGPQWQDLVSVCEAYASYKVDVGYVYGMQLVAALILLQLPDPADAFILMANCLNKTMPLAFQTGDVAATTRTYSKVKSTLDIKFPQLHAYLFDSPEKGGLGFQGQELLEHIFRTGFANGLDIDRLCRVWDIWIFESDRYLIRTAVALLGALRTQIFGIEGDHDLRRRNIQEMFGWGPFNRADGGYWKLSSLGNGDSFVDEIRAAGKLDCAGR